MKEQFGYDQGIQRYLQDVEKSIPKGSFNIISKGKNRYWYFALSRGNNRVVHLCSVLDKGGESNSFLNAIKVLKKKLNENPTSTRQNTLVKVIDDYIQNLREEGATNRRGTERTKKTIQDIVSHIRKFREYIEKQPIGLKDLEREDFREYFSGFVNHLIDSGLKPPTIRVILIHSRQFLDALVSPTLGKRIINYHPITQQFVKSQFSENVRNKTQPDFYTEDRYKVFVKYCGDEMRSIWIEYLKTSTKPEKYKIIYFTSFLQLVYGFRIGELLTTYLSEDVKREYHSSKKSGYSFLEDVGSDGYIFNVYWKRKHGSVNVDYMVNSWGNTPPNTIPYEKRSVYGGKRAEYATNVVDVIKTLFSDDKLLLPINVDTLRKHFRIKLLGVNYLNDTGVKTPHDLRDMMINYELHTKKTSFVDLAQMTRNKIQTIEKYYLHTSKELSISKSKKLNTKNRLSEINQLLSK